MTLPSFYLGKLDRKRKRSDEFSGDMDSAAKQGMGALDMMSRLQAKLGDDKLKADRAKVDADDKKTERDFKERELGLKGRAVDARIKDDETDAIARSVYDDERMTNMRRDDERSSANDEYERELKKKKLAMYGQMTPEQRAMYDARMQLLGAQTDAAHAAAGMKGQPTVNEAGDVTELDRSIADAEKMVEEKKSIDTGPLANIQNDVAQWAGVDDAKVTQFKASSIERAADYIKSISGATVSEPERRNLMKLLPTMADNDAAFSAKLGRIVQKLKDTRDSKVRAIGASGKNTGSFAQPKAEPATAGPPIADQSTEALEARLAKLRGGK